MTWLTWRQFRVSALTVFAGLVAVGVLLGITGPQLVGRTDFSDSDFLYVGTSLLMYLLPAIVGVFWGVPLVTRELESGTHSLVWNQTITRKRWLATKLGAGVLGAMIAAGLLSLAVTWWASPIDALANQSTDRSMLNWMSPVVFAARGIVPIGYAAFAFVLGVAVGIVLRRTVAAMAVTLVLFAAVQLAVPLLVRPHILPAVNETVAITAPNITGIRGDAQGLESISVRKPAGAWELANETVDPAGNTVSRLPDFVQGCMPRPGQGAPSQVPDIDSIEKCVEQLGERGYQQHLAYQPGFRFWPLQWTELGFFVALSALLTWFCFRRLRHVA
ncbi:ABC transporter permease subunit [Amycolatopsis taiwanensis]|uniref:Transporter n=1 Tax=Amycolatopsis taiwanensis TaxID=342230 RepID=A0A9W6VG63_9PSEU|nr:ABC transporter permease subunit [Amycolatopsis taiwanensis]GLY66202.1 transporter [Amycolatopsis taiwanensis]